MSKSDAEISLKVNMPPPRSFEQTLHAFEKLSTGVRDSMRDFGEKVKDVSESVRILKDRAAATGSESVQRVVAAGFSQTELDEAANMDKQAEKIRVNFGKLEDKVYALKQAYEAGLISEDAAAKKMEYFVRVAQKANVATSSLVYNLHTVDGDLRELGQMDDVLGAFDALRIKMKDVSGGAKSLSDNLTNQANALAEQRESLDTSAPGYEQMAAALSKQENELRKASAAALDLGANAEKSFRKAKESFQGYAGGTEETAKLMADIQNRLGQMESQERKLQGLQADAANREQQRLAKKEIETEREIELSKRKEEQERKAALAQQQRQEADAYRTELLGKTKLELAAIIKQLNAEMVAAGKAEDWQQLDVLKQKMSIARSAMRNASMQANITRMTFMQQAATAGRLSNNVSTLADGFGALSEGAKNGQINLTGMASSMMDLWFTMKAGMGPIGWLTMGLEAVQRMLNNTALHEQNLKKIREESNNSITEEITAYEKLGASIRRANQQELLKKSVAEVKDKYKELNTELQNGFNIIEKSLQAEKDKSLVIQGEQKHLVELQKLELKRRLISGEITQESYDSEMLNIDSAAVINAARQEQENAKKDLESSRLKAEKSSDALELAKAYFQNYTMDASVYGTSAETIKAREEYRAALLSNVEKAQKATQDIIKRNKNKSFFSKLGEGAENIAALYQRGLGFAEISKKFDLNITMESERFLKELEEASRESSRAQQELFDFDEESRKLLKGKTEEQYLAEQAKANAKRDAAKAELDRVEEEDKKTQKAAKDAEERKKKADKNLSDVQKREGELLRAKQKNLDAQIEKSKQDKEADRKAEKLSKKLEREARRFKEKSLEELEKLKTKAIKAQGTDEKAYQYRPYKSFIQQLDDIIYERKEIAGRIKQESQAEVQSRAGSNKALAKYSKLLNKVDFKELSGVLDDGSISEPELKLLQREWVDAVKARNATAMAFIQKLIQDAAESKRQDEAIVGAINTTRKKMEKQAQRMQKKLKTTLK